VTILVTADHECGGLEVLEDRGAGVLPLVRWERGGHTNARVDVFGAGPGSGWFHDQVRDHAWIHEVAAARLERRPVAPPPGALVPDGELGDLRHVAVLQAAASGFGEGHNRLDALHLDADERGLAIGLEGIFERGRNAVVVLLDVDLGAGTGPARLAGALSDRQGRADGILSSLSLDAPAVPGFGADLAIVVWGGADPMLEDRADAAGLRGLRWPYGAPDDLHWLGVAVAFADDVRGGDSPLAPIPGRGLELFVPWRALYPEHDGAVPPGATLGLAAVLVNDDGGYTSNQALPPFAPTATNPGRELVPIPGVVSFTVDSIGDGRPDAELPPVVLSP
jgi:hypothetical protein